MRSGTAERAEAAGSRGTGIAIVAPAVAIYVAVFVVPGLLMLLASFRESGGDGGLGVSRYIGILTDPLALEAIWNSIFLSVVTTVLCLVLGFPLAYQAARGGPLTRMVLLLAVTFPLFTSAVVRTFGWQVLLFPHGTLTSMFKWMGMARPPVLIGTEIGIVLVQTAIFLPFMVLTLYGTIRNIDESIEHAAADLGDGPLMVWFRVTLPLSMKALVGGMVIVFSVSLSAYITPKLIGQSRVQTLAMSIYDEAAVLIRYEQAAAYSAILLILTLAGVYVALRFTRDDR